MTVPNHETFLRRALQLAQVAWGETHPNPMVGCVLVEEGTIVAEGFHARAGEPHAEIMALGSLGRAPKPDATLYLTLEPCSTHGRTPPCVNAILEAGIKLVVVGARDPNPAHAGNGLEQLREAGSKVIEIEGEVAADCHDLNLIFNHQVVTAEPFFALKLAVTADGKVAEESGISSPITGSEARADVMRWRRLFPAIAVGAGTVVVDDPRLTARFPEGEWCPRRIILDGRLSSVPDNGALPGVYSDEHRANTLVVTTPDSSASRRDILAAAGVGLRELPASSAGHFSFADLKALCSDEGLTGVFFEGGPTVAHGLLAEQALDYLYWYESPKRFENEDAPQAPPFSSFSLGNPRIAHLGLDVLTRGHLS
ncbi:MAG: bifunctional diaminohydroxyphosphoribosylaminopyrimidine deaminase/5-amino-6-(5-phosphoribosylamino)uracil reductase RibD [Opitutales bacterium]